MTKGRLRVQLIEDERVLSLESEIEDLESRCRDLQEKLQHAYMLMGAACNQNAELLAILRKRKISVPPKYAGCLEWCRESVLELFGIDAGSLGTDES